VVFSNGRELMPTATLDYTFAANKTQRSIPAPAVYGRLGWVLMLPLLFFAVHGQFSFQFGAGATGGFSPGAVQANNTGILEYALAAITYLVIAWLIKSELSQVVAYAMRFKTLTFLAFLAISSAAWSQSPMRSAFHGLYYLIGTLFAYYLVIRFEPDEIMTYIKRLGVLSCFLSLILVAFFPQFGLVHNDPRNGLGWQGIFIDRTTAAKCLVFLLSPALAVRARWDRKRVFYVLLLSVMILMAHSVGSLFVLFTYVAFLFTLRLSRKLDSRALLIVSIFAFAVAVPLAMFALEFGPAILKAFGRDPTLTGRTVIWSFLMHSISKRPMLGYGYYAFWLGLKGESGQVIYAVNWTFGYAHNGLIEILLQLGLVGVVVFFISLLKAIKDAWFCFRRDRTGHYDWYIGLIVLTIIYNIDEVTVLLPNDLLSILYVVACCGLAAAVKQLKQNKHLGVGLSDGSLPFA
jgi:exopolysaccharide production protein ExoQ